MATAKQQPTYTRAEVDALIEARHAHWLEEVDQLIALALAPIRDDLAESFDWQAGYEAAMAKVRLLLDQHAKE